MIPELFVSALWLFDAEGNDEMNADHFLPVAPVPFQFGGTQLLNDAQFRDALRRIRW
jgi:hypothetical protein